MTGLSVNPQEIAFDHPQSRCMFQPSPQKPIVATRAAMDSFGPAVIIECLNHLQRKARKHDGLDYLQVFESRQTGDKLWFIEDGEGGAITALLPSDY